MRCRRLFGVGVVAVSAGLVAACTWEPEPTAGQSPDPAAVAPHAAKPSRPASDQPLVLGVRASRSTLSVSERAARRIVAGAASTWASIDGSSAPLRVVRATTPTRARQILAADPDTVVVMPASALRPFARAVVVNGVD